MKINKSLKRALAIGLGAYITAYAGLAGYVHIDYRKNGNKTSENAQNILNFKEFSCDVDGKKKNLGLVGEKHLYNHNEQIFAGELIKKYKTLVFEGSVNEPGSKIDRMLNKVCGTLSHPYIYFYRAGSGRSASHPYDVIRLKNTLALFNGEKITPLIPLEEHNATDDMNLTQKALAFLESAKELAIAPVAYFEGKKEASKEDQKVLERYRVNGEKRDQIFSDKLEEILKDNKTKDVLCFIGRAHVDSIISNLEKKIKLEEKTAEK